MTDPARPIPESYWVVPGKFLAGEYPGGPDVEISRQRMDAFLEAGFDTFIDLTAPDEREAYLSILVEEAGYYERTIHYNRNAIVDFGVLQPEQMKAILDTIDEAVGGGRQVYLHCRAGVGRTGTTVGCYLVRHGMTGEGALHQLAGWWGNVPKSRVFPRSPETPQQEKLILEWQE